MAGVFPGRLLAISDIHVSHRANREALASAGAHPDDWLIVAGDVGEKPEHLELALDTFVPRFARVIWTPGNHDLWCPPGAIDRTRGQARYEQLLDICRAGGVTTPEDPYLEWPGAPGVFIVPMFLLFDYSFRPPEVALEDVLVWARQTGVGSGDEQMLDPAPWPSIAAWCDARCDATAERLDALPPGSRTILVNHWPLRYDLARPPRVPRFSVWSGTARTEDWPQRYRAVAVVNGHLHFRTTMWRQGVRHEEVSLGYPRDWRQERGIDWYLREILPGTSADAHRFVPPRDPFGDRPHQ
jgi:3',5'-cyclic AMP phosphodiesterase CpdA